MLKFNEIRSIAIFKLVGKPEKYWLISAVEKVKS
jgi:hypothetical protein